MHNNMASAAKSEYGTIFINAQTAVTICTTLVKMGWKQVPRAIQVDNSTAIGITTEECCQKNSNAMDMRFYRVND